MKVVVGTRGSKLALTQTNWVIDQLKERNPQVEFEVKIIKTKGDLIQHLSLDKIGDKGLFVKEIEQQLLDKEIDIGERLQVKLKNYKKGKSLGAEKTRTYVKTMFNKYLDFAVKPPANKIKERKAEEFKKFLEEYSEKSTK